MSAHHGPGRRIQDYLSTWEYSQSQLAENREKRRNTPRWKHFDRAVAMFNINTTLTPSQSSKVAVAAHYMCPNSQELLVTRERRMNFNSWSIDNYGHPTGSHYPLWVEMESQSGLQSRNTDWGCDTPASCDRQDSRRKICRHEHEGATAKENKIECKECSRSFQASFQRGFLC